MLKFLRKKEGFSLPEVMVGVAVLASVVVASTSLLVTTMRTNNNNAKRLVAMNLAAEGVEAVRNIRDSNWLQGIDWRANTEEGRGLWGTDLNEGTYILSMKSVDLAQNFSVVKNAKADSVSGLKDYVPWKVNLLDTSQCPQKVGGGVDFAQCPGTKIYRHESKDVGVFYNHEPEILNTESNDSSFRRWVEISDVNNEAGEKSELRMRLKSVVVWNDNTGEQRVEIDTELTDWKAGPL